MAKYISSALSQRTEDTQDRQQQQYTIYKEGGPGFTRYIVYTDNKDNRDNTSVNKMVTRTAMKRHKSKSVPPKARERRKTGVGVGYVEGNVVM